MEVAHGVLAQAFWQPDRLKRPGPIGVLAARLSQVGWRLVQGFTFVDQEEQLVDIVNSPIQELRAKAKRARHHKVGCEWAFRKGFAGLQYVDVTTSTQPVPNASQEEAGLIRALLNGTFMTQDHVCEAHEAEDNKCKFCGHCDSNEHPLGMFPHTVTSRLPVS